MQWFSKHTHLGVYHQKHLIWSNFKGSHQSYDQICLISPAPVAQWESGRSNGFLLCVQLSPNPTEDLLLLTNLYFSCVIQTGETVQESIHCDEDTVSVLWQWDCCPVTDVMNTEDLVSSLSISQQPHLFLPVDHLQSHRCILSNLYHLILKPKAGWQVLLAAVRHCAEWIAQMNLGVFAKMSVGIKGN